MITGLLRSASVILFGGLLACACSHPFDGTTYRGSGFAFRVPARPAAWQQLEADGANLAFHDANSDAMAVVSARCGKDAEDIPLVALTRHLVIGYTEREESLEETVPFDGREARHTVMSAKLDGVPVKLDIWVMKKDGCVYDLYYFTKPDRFDAGVGEFRAFVKGFSTVPFDR